MSNIIDNDFNKSVGVHTNETTFRSHRPIPRTAELFAGKNFTLFFQI